MRYVSNPRTVWRSGYKVSVQTWQDWTPTLPLNRRISAEVEDITLYSRFYQKWRFHLPEEEAKVTPTFRNMYPDDPDNHPVEFMFFPFRYTKYTGEDQVNVDHPDYSAICEENETDKARLTNFLNYVKDIGAPLDETKVFFAWMKNEHPQDDHRPVSSDLSELLQMFTVFGDKW